VSYGKQVLLGRVILRRGKVTSIRKRSRKNRGEKVRVLKQGGREKLSSQPLTLQEEKRGATMHEGDLLMVVVWGAFIKGKGKKAQEGLARVYGCSPGLKERGSHQWGGLGRRCAPWKEGQVMNRQLELGIHWG